MAFTDEVVEKRTIYRPLVAVVCMARKTADGDKIDEVDRAAKNVDYQNTLIGLNNLDRLDCAYQLMKENDIDAKTGETEDTKGTFTLEKAVLTKDAIKDLKLKLLWKKEQVIEFCSQVVKLIDDDKNGYDSLIFVISAHGKQNQREKDENFHQIPDSLGTLFSLEQIYTLFDKDHSSTDALRFPKIFMVDRYFESTFKDKNDMVKYNGDSDMMLEPIEMDGKGQIIQFFGHEQPLALEKTNETGGVVSRAIQEKMTKKPTEFQDNFKEGKVRDYCSVCSLYITTAFKVNASAWRKSPTDEYEVYFMIDIWDPIRSWFTSKE